MQSQHEKVHEEPAALHVGAIATLPGTVCAAFAQLLVKSNLLLVCYSPSRPCWGMKC